MRELIERIEAADGPSFALDVEIAKLIAYPGFPPPSFTASIDAALTLLPEGWVVGSLEWWPKRPHGAGVALLETWRFEGFDGYDASVHRKTSARAASPALALVAAIFRARGEG